MAGMKQEMQVGRVSKHSKYLMHSYLYLNKMWKFQPDTALSAYNAYKDLKIGTGLSDSMSMSYIIIGLISFPTFVLLQWGTQLLIWYDLWGHVTLSYSFLVGGVSYAQLTTSRRSIPRAMMLG